MKTRHKIPAVFSIYMVDVLCCALGCVILLWQLYHQDAEEQAAANQTIRAELDRACKAENVVIRSAFIRNILIPDAFLEQKRLEQKQQLQQQQQMNQPAPDAPKT